MTDAGLIVVEAEAAPAAGLTVREVARRYRICKNKVRRWIANGELRAVNTVTVLCGRPRWIIPPDALPEFERRRPAAAEGGPAAAYSPKGGLLPGLTKQPSSDVIGHGLEATI
jgi:excisionase family DNA binding protein